MPAQLRPCPRCGKRVPKASHGFCAACLSVLVHAWYRGQTDADSAVSLSR
jgi:endogenous inhibitor of DNA gyrase (YacG/DUF329 family)